MRINQFVARASGLSRRSADDMIASGRVTVNGEPPVAGYQVNDTDEIALDGQPLTLSATTTVLLNKPVGYVCSRRGQGSRTVYDLLPAGFHGLKPVGRLDKDSSGLLLLTDDGELAQQLTHPRYAKEKIYRVTLDTPLAPADRQQLEGGIRLEDGPSRLFVQGRGKQWEVRLYEGRNRQIRRTFAHLGYQVMTLHRTHFGPYELGKLAAGRYSVL